MFSDISSICCFHIINIFMVTRMIPMVKSATAFKNLIMYVDIYYEISASNYMLIWIYSFINISPFQIMYLFATLKQHSFLLWGEVGLKLTFLPFKKNERQMEKKLLIVKCKCYLKKKKKLFPKVLDNQVQSSPTCFGSSHAKWTLEMIVIQFILRPPGWRNEWGKKSSDSWNRNRDWMHCNYMQLSQNGRKAHQSLGLEW